MSYLVNALSRRRPPDRNPWDPALRDYSYPPNIRYVQSPSQRARHRRMTDAIRKVRGY